MDKLIIVYKEGQYLFTSKVGMDCVDFLNTYLDVNEIGHEGVVAHTYLRTDYNRLLMLAQDKDKEILSELGKVILRKKTKTEKTVELEYDWLNGSNLEDHYNQETIDKILENREYAESFGCLKKVDFSKFPHEIPLVTIEGVEYVYGHEILEELIGTKVELD